MRSPAAQLSIVERLAAVRAPLKNPPIPATPGRRRLNLMRSEVPMPNSVMVAEIAQATKVPTSKKEPQQEKEMTIIHEIEQRRAHDKAVLAKAKGLLARRRAAMGRKSPQLSAANLISAGDDDDEYKAAVDTESDSDSESSTTAALAELSRLQEAALQAKALVAEKARREEEARNMELAAARALEAEAAMREAAEIELATRDAARKAAELMSQASAIVASQSPPRTGPAPPSPPPESPLPPMVESPTPEPEAPDTPPPPIPLSSSSLSSTSPPTVVIKSPIALHLPPSPLPPPLPPKEHPAPVRLHSKPVEVVQRPKHELIVPPRETIVQTPCRTTRRRSQPQQATPLPKTAESKECEVDRRNIRLEPSMARILAYDWFTRFAGNPSNDGSTHRDCEFSSPPIAYKQTQEITLESIVAVLFRTMRSGFWAEKCEASEALLYVFKVFQPDFLDPAGTFLIPQLEFLNDDDWRVRIQTCQNLVQYGIFNLEVVYAIICKLLDKHNAVRTTALRSLAALGIDSRNALREVMMQLKMLAAREDPGPDWLDATSSISPKRRAQGLPRMAPILRRHLAKRRRSAVHRRNRAALELLIDARRLPAAGRAENSHSAGARAADLAQGIDHGPACDSPAGDTKDPGTFRQDPGRRAGAIEGADGRERVVG
ncbi:hypothetical protein BDK51DRAFT_36617 [Blyttiomyces helicus]|uniref:Uncharacterized protein n=1 Tax=Blyttiomyces helicus TaxID=388810 RepID=A0A4P9W2R3_9FUNG|nr:hypothetical protein BDK51DRAFT_36617 [Blyttiomyces helicus]|eukprot:RKO86042.1 hypothetical protein BDK51DRAFT_36617 [Blyttiomyces helicus]